MAIPMPQKNLDIAGLNRFATEVYRSLAALRDRPVIVPDNPKVEQRHQFKVSPNGDDTVSIYSGHVFYASGADPVVYTTIEHTTSDVTVTASTGFIYYNLTTGSSLVMDESLNAAADAHSMTLASGSMEFQSSALSGSAGNILDTTNVYFPIAEVALTDGVASVTKQIAQGALHCSIQTIADG
jgi:hypothetical protein